jgi:hypothetical protein
MTSIGFILCFSLSALIIYPSKTPRNHSTVLYSRFILPFDIQLFYRLIPVFLDNAYDGDMPHLKKSS